MSTYDESKWSPFRSFCRNSLIIRRQHCGQIGQAPAMDAANLFRHIQSLAEKERVLLQTLREVIPSDLARLPIERSVIDGFRRQRQSLVPLSSRTHKDCPAIPRGVLQIRTLPTAVVSLADVSANLSDPRSADADRKVRIDVGEFRT